MRSINYINVEEAFGDIFLGSENGIACIGLDNFRVQVTHERRPVLMACIYRGYEFAKQIDVLRQIQDKYSNVLKISYIDEDDRRIFMKTFNISGTPTYILFQSGQEKDRLLGNADADTLTGFIQRAIPTSRSMRVVRDQP